MHRTTRQESLFDITVTVDFCNYEILLEGGLSFFCRKFGCFAGPLGSYHQMHRIEPQAPIYSLLNCMSLFFSLQ